MRATTPAHPMGKYNGLHKPDFQIGDVVVRGKSWNRDISFYRAQYALKLIKQSREVLKRLVRGGHQKPFVRLPPHTKKHIRDCVRRFSEAEEFIIAGVKIDSGPCVDICSYNACYVSGIPGACSPPEYKYQLLVKFKNDDGNNMALITSIGLSRFNLQLKDGPTIYTRHHS